jgi:PDZ domain/Aspartyl protease
MKAIAMAIAIALPVAAQSPESSEGVRARAPITFTRNQVRIPVSVNGSGPFMLILDTGMPAPGILLRDSDRVQALKLQLPGADTLTGGGSGPAVAARVAEGQRIEVGGLALDGVSVSVLPAQIPLGGADGVIGAELFDRFVVRVDVDTKELSLIDKTGYEPEAGAGVIPLRLPENMAFIDARVVVESGDPITVDLAVDLGAGHALWLNQREPGRLAPPAKAIHTTLGRGISGDIHGAFARTHRIELGPFAFENVVTLFPAPEHQNPGGVDFRDGFVGAELLTRFVVTFDYPSKRMVLVPGARFREPFEFDMTGMMLDAGERDRRRIDAVLPDSPANDAGVRAGDVLLAVDGRRLDEIGPDGLRRAFQRDGAEVRVTLERNATTIEKTLRLRRLL